MFCRICESYGNPFFILTGSMLCSRHFLLMKPTGSIQSGLVGLPECSQFVQKSRSKINPEIDAMAVLQVALEPDLVAVLLRDSAVL